MIEVHFQFRVFRFFALNHGGLDLPLIVGTLSDHAPVATVVRHDLSNNIHRQLQGCGGTVDFFFGVDIIKCCFLQCGFGQVLLQNLQRQWLQSFFPGHRCPGFLFLFIRQVEVFHFLQGLAF